MTVDSSVASQSEDPVSNVLKWVLLGVGIVTFAILAWTVKLTYEAAPPFPERFVDARRCGPHDRERHTGR